VRRFAQNSKICVLNDSKSIADRMATYTPEAVSKGVLSMYSSSLDAIITEQSMMSIPLDDHGFHRGHAVFDTCNVHNGQVYGLDMHIDRLLLSASMARIEPGRFSKTFLKEIILQTIAASGKADGVGVRFWMTSGRGDFYITPKNCSNGANFYVVVHEKWGKANEATVKEVVVSTPLKPKLLANMKSNNYMINALTAMEAEDDGGYLGMQIDSDGYLQEASISCVAIVEEDNVLRTPKFDMILASTTVQRSLELGESLVSEGMIRSIEQTNIKIDQVYEAKEVILLGGHSVVAVGQVNDILIGDGKRGPVCKALQELQEQDMSNPEMIDPIPDIK